MIHNFSLYSCLYVMAKRLLLFVASDKICFIFLFFLPHIECNVAYKGIGMLKLGRMHRQTGEKFVVPTAMSRQMREVSDF